MSQTHVPAALGRLVRERATERCEYCLTPEQVSFAPHWIDHVIAEKHGGQMQADNLALACVLCNQHKGSDLSSIDPTTGALVPLFHPRQDRWADHFQLAGCRVDALTDVGRVTVRLLHLNDTDRVEERGQLLAAGLNTAARATVIEFTGTRFPHYLAANARQPARSCGGDSSEASP